MTRILAIAPGTRHLGFAVFEGAELVRFGIRNFPGRKRASAFIPQVEKYIGNLIERSRAHVLVVEDTFYVQARKSAMLQRMVRALKQAAARDGTAVQSVLPTAVKARFCTEKATRRNLATAMAGRYPFLKPLLDRRPPNYWQQLFDAVALGAYACDENAQPQKGTLLVDTSLSAKT